jgi:hypothetical protein
MSILDFIYRLIERFVPITTAQVQALELEARNKFYSEEFKTSKIGALVHKYAEEWWAKTLLAVAFIFVSKGLLEYVNAKPESSQDDNR